MSLVRGFGYHLHVDILHVELYFILQQWTFNNTFKRLKVMHKPLIYLVFLLRQ